MAGVSAVYDRDGEHIGWKVSVRKKGFPPQFKTFRTKAEALAWASVVESEMVRGVWRDRAASESTTLKECLDRYAADVLPTRKDGGWREASFLRRWQERPIADRYMAGIRGQDVAIAIRDMEAEKKKPNTIRLHLALLSNLFTVARKEWGMEALDNPVESVRKPKLPQGRDRRLVGDEENRLLDACSKINPELAAIVRMAIETGMRQGEIMGMKWSMVNLSARTVTLPDTKNGTRRTVPLSSRAVAVLEALPRNLNGRVWTYTQDRLKAIYRTAVARAGITGLTFHDLRHEATSRLFEKGFNPMEVSAITGHKTLQMLKRYTYLRAEDLAKRMG
ncbi:integrase [Acidithiobacillus ferrivorans]|uniref:Integrase n=1 Tax=Acidithiobacillus ferrivorans TaxID=160808 RepID=A0A1B9BZV9_9PROT|nr:site-specific integrase [Acidithiobacillus ferrivorans]OCB03266.1 integrase [Acidithiobacillus ferrivorans]